MWTLHVGRREYTLLKSKKPKRKHRKKIIMEENAKLEQILNEADSAKTRNPDDEHLSSSSSSSDSDGESSKTRVNHDEKFESLVQGKEDEVVHVEDEPLIENTIREPETLFDDGSANSVVSSSDVNEMESVTDLSASVKQYVVDANEMKDQSILLSLEEQNGLTPNVVIENGLVAPEDPVTEQTTQVERSPDTAESLIKPKEETIADDYNATNPAAALAVNLPSVVAEKSSEREVEVETPEYIPNQPVISLAPRARVTASWMNCCGLFEVLRSPDR